MAITNARMQIKRGNEVDFDSEKMLVGEWALSTDKKIVRICVAPNVCIRMATYDAFEVDMAQIEKILEECQTIEEAVKQIQSEIYAKEIVIEQYVQNAKTYSETAANEADRATLEADRAKTEADRASSIANIGIATTEKAGIVKPDGKTITVDADGTIHADNGTIDYNELENKPKINDVELSGSKSLSELGIASADDLEETNSKVNIIIEKAELNIKNSASGDNIHLTDSANSKVVEFGLYGKATQDGEPTTDNPIEIVVSGSDGSVEVVSVGKNFLKNTATSQTINGVTFTVNEDKSVTVNGTATARIDFQICQTSEFSGKCILSGCPSGGNSKYLLEYSNYVDKSYKDYGAGVEIEKFDYQLYPKARVNIRIESGTQLNNIVFKPMIRLATDTDATYEPYKETVSTIPTPNGLCGIKVSSGGNYTDENGQQWLCDEVVKYADGSGKRIQRIGKKIFDGTETFNINTSTDGGGYYYSYKMVEFGEYSGNSKPIALCNKLIKYTPNELWKNSLNGFTIGTLNYNIILRFTSLPITTIEELQTQLAEWYANGEPLIILAKLAEPIIIDLTAEEIAEIENLCTFYPVTNISNDADCGMSVTYLCDSKNYIDSKIAELATAMVNNI